MRVGLSSFKDHPYFSLSSRSSLLNYAENLGFIELDTVFYGIPRKETVEKWQQQVPIDFKFAIKAYGGMTDHVSYLEQYQSQEEMYQAFKTSFQPLKEKNQIAAVLFQFSSSFVFSKENGLFLMAIKTFLPDWPIAIEFRHGSWFTRENIKKTLTLLTKLGFSLVAVDEPQLANFPVPFFIYPTNLDFLYLRLHGRNKMGWLSGDRNFRTLYDYSEEELADLSQKIAEKISEFKKVYVVFNNNAGLHAAKNSVTFQQLNTSKLERITLNPRQTDLF